MQRNQDMNHLSRRDRLVIHDVGLKAGVSTISILLPTATMAPKWRTIYAFLVFCLSPSITLLCRHLERPATFLAELKMSIPIY